jgi:hypothetical protein
MSGRVTRWSATAALIMSALALSACKGPGGYGGSEPEPTTSLNIKPQQPVQTSGVSPGDPFLGSPAHKFANGADGIELPQAKAVSGFGAAQVRSDLKTVKWALTKANLDAKVWRGARPQGLINLFDPRDGYQARIQRSFGHPSATNNPLNFATRFDPRRAVVHGQIVKVHGKMSVKGIERGRLRIHTDYLFVYAVRQVGVATKIERVVVRRITDYEFYDPARFQVTPGTFVLNRASFSSANADCDQDGGYIKPSFDNAAATESGEPSGAPVDPYDQANEDTREDCSPVTRT